jgi:hypothetical protein
MGRVARPTNKTNSSTVMAGVFSRDGGRPVGSLVERTEDLGGAGDDGTHQVGR